MLRLLAAALLSFVFLWACRPERLFTDDKEAKLEFSTDTLRFDTVFTELGTATRILKVFNPHGRSIRIASVSLGEGSPFRMNVDGIPGNTVEDVEISPRDSIYIFVEATIDPDAPVSASPFVINRDIVFMTNGNEQRVVLEAWGQNANYIPNRFSKGGVALLSCNLGEVKWDDPKPYVIYGILLIDSCTLTLPPGARLYVHGGVAKSLDEQGNPIIYNDGLIYVLPNGKLKMEGDLENPVVVQGDRLEADFAERAGQWVGIRLASKGNVFRNSIIKNSLVGVYLDSAAAVVLEEMSVYNTSGPGIFSLHANIQARNCLIYNNGSTSVQLAYGGDYQFDYCTMASYGVDASALSLSNGICYDLLCTSFNTYRINASFRNCIIFGSRQDEIILTDFSKGALPALFNVSMRNSVVRVNNLLDPAKGGYPEFFNTICQGCINGSPVQLLFENPGKNDYQLDSLSIAIGVAAPISGITSDRNGKPRDPVNPDAGCFERED
jgi:hypothetical protein